MAILYHLPAKLDKNLYLENQQNKEAYYGLPNDVKFCKSCVISNQRPSTSVEFLNDGLQKKKAINFDKNLRCDACSVREEKSKERKENYMFLGLVVGLLAVTGIIASL